MKILVTGAGGFIGGHLVGALLAQDYEVRAVDIKPKDEWFQNHEVADNMLLDLRSRFCCKTAVDGMDRVYNLATDMGGIGYLTSHRLDPMLSVLVNTHLLDEARRAGVKRYLFTSSACIYGEGIDTREHMAYPAMCEDGYGWEKLFGERMCRHFDDETDLETRVARLHNVYGPLGSWNDGREKAPAAVCRKVAEAEDGRIQVWGDGKQTRSFMHISDCLKGLDLIMNGGLPDPVNLGSTERLSINDLVGKVAKIAGKDIAIDHDLDAPRGVQGRNSNNRLMRQRYGWAPGVTLDEGLVDTYDWIARQVGVPRERSDWAMPAWGRSGT